MNISIPWRYFISNSIRQGYLPLWYPNQLFGMAQYIDPQTWYWPSWLLGLLGYTNLTLHLEFILHLYLAAIGCFKLCEQIGINSNTAKITGLIYAMSGFFVGNAQHIGWIVSATWIPLIIYQFIQFIDRIDLKSTLGLSLSLYLFITGGYWSFVVTTYYFLVILYIYKIYQKYSQNQLHKKDLIKLLKYTLLLILLNIITSSIVLYSLYESMHLIDRGNMSIEFTLYGSFLPIDFLTLIAPIATYAHSNGFWEADVSLINIYIGIFSLFIFIWSFIFQRSILLKNYKLILLAFFIIVLSMGYSFPLRAWFSEYIPLFDHFRYPSAYRIYFILILCTLLGIAIDNLDINNPYYKKGIIIFSLILLLTGVIIFIKDYSSIFEFIHHFVPKPTKFPLSILFTFQLFLSAFLIISYYLINKHLKIENKKSFLRLFIIIELVITSLLNMPNTVIDISQNPYKIYSTIKKIERSSNDSLLTSSSLKEINEYCNKIFPFGRNSATYPNLTSNTQYSSYQFKSTRKIEDSLYYEISNNPLAYFINNKDSISSQRNIESIKLHPNKIILNLAEGEDSILCLSQNYHKNWRCIIDNNSIPIEISNVSLMRIRVPNKKCKVIFSFKSPVIRFYFWISLIIFLVQTIIFLKYYIKILPQKKG